MKKWVKALRSGKYKQGGGTLKQFNKKGQTQHCCLGVLCELYNDSMRKSKKKVLSEKVCYNDSDFSHGYCRFGNKREDLPKEVKNWAGMNDNLGRFYLSDDHYECLADLNDMGKKFKTIANIIEKNYEQL